MEVAEIESLFGVWRVERSHGDAGEFHRRDPRPERSATFHTVDAPTLVLVSAQSEATVDHEAARAHGVEIVRRRSGGGGVLLMPGEFVWLDLVVPADDPRWSNDVAEAMVWVGEMWQGALRSIGAAAGTDVHRGPLISSVWSKLVCFAGVGTGEVIRGSGKLVGVSQRRTRDWARLQSMCHLRWRPELAAALVDGTLRPTAADLVDVVACVDADAGCVEQALLDELLAW